MSKSIRAWHFLKSTNKHPLGVLRNGRPAPRNKQWLVHEGPIKICNTGLHASTNLLDALNYAPGMMLCHVRCSGVQETERDKLVCRRRRIEWRVDAEPALRAFARWCALQVVRTWPAPDVVHDWLLTGDARYRAGAYSAADSAAWSAAESAAHSASDASVCSAAHSASTSAARLATYSETRQIQARKLCKMINKARKGKSQWTFRMPKK